MFRWVWRLVACFRGPVDRNEAITIAVRAMRHEFQLPVFLSRTELPQAYGKPFYILRSCDFASTDMKRQLLEENACDEWAVEFEYRDPTWSDRVDCEPCGPLVCIDARTREIEIPWRI